MRRLFNGARGENELENLLAVRPQFADDFYRMVMLDFATRQDDRHLSNMAIKVSEAGEEFYPLYDNGAACSTKTPRTRFGKRRAIPLPTRPRSGMRERIGTI